MTVNSVNANQAQKSMAIFEIGGSKTTLEVPIKNLSKDFIEDKLTTGGSMDGLYKPFEIIASGIVLAATAVVGGIAGGIGGGFLGAHLGGPVGAITGVIGGALVGSIGSALICGKYMAKNF